MQGLILAAGSSSRLGQAKQLVSLGGQTQLERTVRLIFSVCDEVTVLLGAHAAACQSVLDPLMREFPALRIHVCASWESGMGSTLAEGLQLMQDDVCIMLCDLPFIDQQHLQVLVDRSKANPDLIIVSQFASQQAPPVIIPFAKQSQFYDWSGDAGLGRFFKENPTQIAICSFPDDYRDLDTSEDLRYWEWVFANARS